MNRSIYCNIIFFITLFIFLINPSYSSAQSSVVDELWQKWVAKDDPHKMEHFLYDLKDTREHLDINSITYGLNLVFSGPYNHNRPKELLLWTKWREIFIDTPPMHNRRLFFIIEKRWNKLKSSIICPKK